MLAQAVASIVTGEPLHNAPASQTATPPLWALGLSGFGVGGGMGSMESSRWRALSTCPPDGGCMHVRIYARTSCPLYTRKSYIKNTTEESPISCRSPSPHTLSAYQRQTSATEALSPATGSGHTSAGCRWLWVPRRGCLPVGGHFQLPVGGASAGDALPCLCASNQTPRSPR